MRIRDPQCQQGPEMPWDGESSESGSHKSWGLNVSQVCGTCTPQEKNVHLSVSQNGSALWDLWDKMGVFHCIPHFSSASFSLVEIQRLELETIDLVPLDDQHLIYWASTFKVYPAKNQQQFHKRLFWTDDFPRFLSKR